jgi:hypothetical protein
VFIDDDAERGRAALEEYCQATYHASLDWAGQIQLMLTGPDLVAQLRRFFAASARHVLLRVAAVHPDVFAEQLSRLAELLHASRVTSACLLQSLHRLQQALVLQGGADNVEF